MKYEISSAFQKEYRKLKDPALAADILNLINIVAHAGSIKAIPDMKKMRGHALAYRIRIRNYRIGIFLENETIVFTAIAHRKDIYKHFP